MTMMLTSFAPDCATLYIETINSPVSNTVQLCRRAIQHTKMLRRFNRWVNTTQKKSNFQPFGV